MKVIPFGHFDPVTRNAEKLARRNAFVPYTTDLSRWKLVHDSMHGHYRVDGFAAQFSINMDFVGDSDEACMIAWIAAEADIPGSMERSNICQEQPFTTAFKPRAAKTTTRWLFA